MVRKAENQLHHKQSLLLSDEYTSCDLTPPAITIKENLVPINARNKNERLSECGRLGNFSGQNEMSVTETCVNQLPENQRKNQYLIVLSGNSQCKDLRDVRIADWQCYLYWVKKISRKARRLNNCWDARTQTQNSKNAPLSQNFCTLFPLLSLQTRQLFLIKPGKRFGQLNYNRFEVNFHQHFLTPIIRSQSKQQCGTCFRCSFYVCNRPNSTFVYPSMAFGLLVQ